MERKRIEKKILDDKGAKEEGANSHQSNLKEKEVDKGRLCSEVPLRRVWGVKTADRMLGGKGE